MSESDLTGIEQRIGSEVDHFVHRVPKKNHDSMVRLNKQFAEIMKKYGAPDHGPFVFKLSAIPKC